MTSHLNFDTTVRVKTLPFIWNKGCGNQKLKLHDYQKGPYATRGKRLVSNPHLPNETVRCSRKPLAQFHRVLCPRCQNKVRSTFIIVAINLINRSLGKPMAKVLRMCHQAARPCRRMQFQAMQPNCMRGANRMSDVHQQRRDKPHPQRQRAIVREKPSFLISSSPPPWEMMRLHIQRASAV